LRPTPRLTRWRDETPGCADRVHLNNAGAALMPAPVLSAIQEHLDLEARIGGYEAADREQARIGACYEAIADLIGCAPRNVAVVENATVAFSQALSAFDWSPGDRIVTSRADYVSNQLMYLSLSRRCGVEVVHAPELEEGGIDPDGLRSLLRTRRPRLVAITWIPTNSGLVQDVHAIGAACAAEGVPYLVDACQAVGQVPVDLRDLPCDFLAGTARKFLRGPRGVGFLAVSDAALERGLYPLYVDMRGADWTGVDEFDLRPDARRFENWEFSYALLLGMGEAARYAADVGEEGFDRAIGLATILRDALLETEGVRVLDRGGDLCAIVTVEIPGRSPVHLRDWLRERGINTTAQARSDAVLDMDAKDAPSLLRLSPHYYNTEEEVARGVEAIREYLAHHPPAR
jgi:selenocysteine lyase/cysteine desulfurase